MNFKVTAVVRNPDSGDLAVLMDDTGRLVIVRLVDGSSANDLVSNNIISSDWEPRGVGVVINLTTGKDINVTIEATDLTPQGVRDWGLPQYPL